MKTTTLLFAAIIAAASMYACSGAQTKYHPVEVAATPTCTECHTEKAAFFGQFNHTADFRSGRHSLTASQQADKVCAACHKASFCSDCHTRKDELKPGDKFMEAPGRMLPHRGDYLTQHRIDGRIDPAPCFKCHGHQNNARCKQCHK